MRPVIFAFLSLLTFSTSIAQQDDQKDALGDSLLGECLARLGTPRFRSSAAVRVLRFSPDGTFLAVGGDDGTVRISEFPSGKEKSTLPGHERGLTFLAY